MAAKKTTSLREAIEERIRVFEFRSATALAEFHVDQARALAELRRALDELVSKGEVH